MLNMIMQFLKKYVPFSQLCTRTPRQHTSTLGDDLSWAGLGQAGLGPLRHVNIQGETTGKQKSV